MEDELTCLLDTWVETREVTGRDGFGKATGTAAGVRHTARVQWADSLLKDGEGRETPIEGVAYLGVSAADIAIDTNLHFADGRTSVVRRVWKVDDQDGLHHVKVAYGR